MSSSMTAATSTLASTTSSFLPIPTGTVSALIGSRPNTTDDYYVAKYLLMAFGETTDPALGALIPPVRPSDYVFETKGPGIILSMSFAMGVMILVTGLRLGVRFFQRGLVVGLDDLFIVPGVLLAVAWPTLQICAVTYGGAGKHIYDVTYEQYGHFKTFTNLSKTIFFVSVGIIKVSICLFNQRLTSLTSRAWSLFNKAFLILLSVYIFLSLFWTLFQCNPPYAGWNPIRVAREGKEFKCISDNIVGVTLSLLHVIMDFGLLSVPLIVLWKVHMGWGTRLRLYFVFSIGAMSCIGSILRQLEQAKLSFDDIVWNFVPLQNWTLVDLSFGVVAASLPILSAFIPKSWNSVRGTADKYSSDNSGPYSNPLERSGHSHQRSIGGSKPGYTRSAGRTSISRKPRRSFSGASTENIIRTDVIELKYLTSTNSTLLKDRDSFPLESQKPGRSDSKRGQVESKSRPVIGLGKQQTFSMHDPTDDKIYDGTTGTST